MGGKSADEWGRRGRILGRTCSAPKGLAQLVGVPLCGTLVGMEMVGGARALVRSLSEEAWILVRLRRKRNDCYAGHVPSTGYPRQCGWDFFYAGFPSFNCFRGASPVSLRSPSADVKQLMWL